MQTPGGTREPPLAISDLQLTWRQAQTSPQTSWAGPEAAWAQELSLSPGLVLSPLGWLCLVPGHRAWTCSRQGSAALNRVSVRENSIIYTCWFCLNMALCRPETCCVPHFNHPGPEWQSSGDTTSTWKKSRLGSLWQCLRVEEVLMGQTFLKCDLVGSPRTPRAPSTVDKQKQSWSQSRPRALGNMLMLFPPARPPSARTPSSPPPFVTTDPSKEKSLEPPPAVKQRNVPTQPGGHAPSRMPVVGTSASTPTIQAKRRAAPSTGDSETWVLSQLVGFRLSHVSWTAGDLTGGGASPQNGPGDSHPCSPTLPRASCKATGMPWT